VHGVVEIGLGIPEDVGDEKEDFKPMKSQRGRVRFLLKETMLRELLEGDKEKKRERKERKEVEKKEGEVLGGQRKMSGFWKRGKKEEVPSIPVTTHE